MRRRIVIILGACACVVTLCELSAAWASAHLASRQSVRDETRAAIALAGPRSVLVVGNSLVQHGISLPIVDRALGAGYETAKVAIVDSGYLDWLYGIASLFDRGSRPDAVVLAISPTQLIEDRAPTGAAARMVWTAPNLVRYAIDNRPGLTAVSDRFFEHVSEFFAVRARLRQNVRRLIVPGYERMARELFAPPDSPDTASDSVRDEAVAEARLRALAGTCARHGARFVFLLVPTNAARDAQLERALARAGQRSGVSVLMPLTNSELSAGWLLDGYHLNATGASTFSTRAGVALAAELSRSLSSSGI